MARLIDSFEQMFDGSGEPLALGLLDFFVSGSSSVRKKTYADAAETIENSNPVVLGGDGRCPNVFGTGTYNVILRTSAGAQLLARDPVGGSDSLTFGADWVASIPYSATDQVRDAGFYWQSLTNVNKGNQPSLDDGTNWLKTNFLSIYYDDIITNTALSDAAATLTAAQLFGGELTITPTVARIQTLDTAANIISALPGSVDGSYFTFTVVNLAAFDVTIAIAAGVTLVGSMVVNDGPANFRVRRLTSSTVSVTRLGVGAALISKPYVSTQQVITSAGLLTLTHGLGVEPRLINFYLVCVTSDLGYSVNDKVLTSLVATTASTTSTSTLYFDATNIYFKFSDTTPTFLIANKSTGDAGGILISSWKLVIKAYA